MVCHACPNWIVCPDFGTQIPWSSLSSKYQSRSANMFQDFGTYMIFDGYIGVLGISWYPVARNRKILGKEPQLLPQLFSFSHRERQRLRHRTWVSVDTRRLTQAVVVIWACLENGVPLSIPWFIINVPIEWPFHVYTPFPDKPFEVLEQHRLVNVLNAHHPTIGEILQQIVESNVHNPQNGTFSNRWTGVNKCSIQDMVYRLQCGSIIFFDILVYVYTYIYICNSMYTHHRYPYFVPEGMKS